MFTPFRKKHSPRRQAIRDDLAEVPQRARWWNNGDTNHLLFAAMVFFFVACVVQFWPGDPLPYREGEIAPTDIYAPESFVLPDAEQTRIARELRRAETPPILLVNQDVINEIQNQLMNFKEDVAAARTVAQVAPSIRQRFPGLTDRALEWLHNRDRDTYETMVRTFINKGLIGSVPLVSTADLDIALQKKLREMLLAAGPSIEGYLVPILNDQVHVVDKTVESAAREDIARAVSSQFPEELQEPITNYIMNLREATYRYSPKLSAAYADKNAALVKDQGIPFAAGALLVKGGERIDDIHYRTLLQASIVQQKKLYQDDPKAIWLSRLGRALIVLILTVAGVVYVGKLSTIKVTLRRAWAICGLLLFTLIAAKVVVTWLPQSMYFMGVAPTLLTAIILVITYNQRFALGLSALHSLLVTLTLGQNIDFFLTLLAGITVFALFLGEIRTRGKLIEVGFLASIAIFATIWAIGLARMSGLSWASWLGGGGVIDAQWVRIQSMYGAIAGIVVSMFALALLPFIERIFKITTAVSLLELCDANKPLLVRLSQEAQGTFNHSLNVGTMAEAAGNAVGANGLLCRVGAYYHDVGKLSKPQYFIENQAAGHPNRHDKLSPAMSLLVIVGHVKDGIELAREYGLPSAIHPFIAQHHGTTLVEYFFHAARKRAELEGTRTGTTTKEISDTEFRYPGPKPQSREAAIVMVCDGSESIVRSIDEPTPGRIESAVHNLIMKRLMDGQFSDCDLTLKDLSIIEETLVRTLVGIHHGRVAYPSNSDEEQRGSDVGISQPA